MSNLQLDITELLKTSGISTTLNNKSFNFFPLKAFLLTIFSHDSNKSSL